MAFARGVLVSHDSLNLHSPVVIVVPLTSQRRARLLPTHVLIPADEEGVDVESVAKCEQVRAVAKSRRCGSALPGRHGCGSWTLGDRPRPRP
ncbi:MAG: type II toxin-antitoxin system PemK/MazF family toxin [Dehalococcoidia bacterium]|nr:type II toxin-antitoxin system PemK/MazF family toxin [Dehalococcoidia bacterium]